MPTKHEGNRPFSFFPLMCAKAATFITGGEPIIEAAAAAAAHANSPLLWELDKLLLLQWKTKSGRRKTKQDNSKSSNSSFSAAVTVEAEEDLLSRKAFVGSLPAE